MTYFLLMFDFHRTVIYVIDATADMCDVN